MDDGFPNYIDEDRPVVLAGDTTDDDGQVLDDLFKPEDPWGLAPSELPRGPRETLHAPRPLTRLITATFPNIRASQGSVMILPPDPDRISLTITVTTVATDSAAYVRLSDDLGKTQMDQGAAGVYPTVIQSIPHTGALYAQVPVGDGLKDYGMFVSVVAVTK